MSGPVVLNLDDFCNKFMSLESLFWMKARYPNFKVTLFTVPFLTDIALIRELKKTGWMEFAVHGFTHDLSSDMTRYSYKEIMKRLSKIDFQVYTRGFRPPYWAINEAIIQACNNFQMWIAFRDLDKLHLCKHGYYAMEKHERESYWFGHTHEVWEGNWVTERLGELLKKWPVDQKFLFVSEALTK